MRHILLFGLLIFTWLFAAATPLFANDTPENEENARDYTQSYPIYDDIDIISTVKIQYDRPRIVVKSVFPQLEPGEDTKTDSLDLDNFNQLVQDLIQTTIADFKQQALTTTASTKSAPKSKNDLYIDYATSFIKSGTHPILSIRFSTQGFISGLAHPYHRYFVLNYDLSTGQQIQLSDLFDPNGDYLHILSDYTRNYLSRHLRNNQLVSQGTTPEADHFKNWNIKPNGILITFDESTVAPYVDGAQSVLIPFSALKEIISLDSPIADCIKNKKRCRGNNVLTGGFIDQVLNQRVINPTNRALNPLLGQL